MDICSKGFLDVGCVTSQWCPKSKKGHVYYRYKRHDCETKTVREELLDGAIREELAALEINAKAQAQANNEGPETDLVAVDQQRSALQLQIKDDVRRLDRL
jgi:hypothetical protein